MKTSMRGFEQFAEKPRTIKRISLLGSIATVLVLTCTYLSTAQGPSPLPAGRDAEEYPKYQFRFTGANLPVNWSVTGGQLPPGLTVSGGGLLSGTPTPDAAFPRPHVYQFQITAVDSSAPAKTAVQTFSLNILPAKPLILAEEVTPAPTATPTPLPFVLTTSTNDEETISLDQKPSGGTVAGVDAISLCVTNVDALIADTLEKDPNAKFKVGDYVVVPLLRWKPAQEGKSEPQKENWAVFERVKGDRWEARYDPADKDNAAPCKRYQDRIFGSKRVVVLPIHFNTPATWDIKYKVSISAVTPTPIADVLALAAAINTSAAIAAAAAPPTNTAWGARMMASKHMASEIVVKLNAVTSNADGQAVEQSKESSKKFTNEGRYHWDVSIGLPVKTLRELTFVSDATNGNKVSTAAKERQDAYGFFNYFPKPVDLRGHDFLTPPHFLFGVPLAGKPLQRPIVGIGTGMYKWPVKFNIFAGVVFNRERVPTTLNVGQSASQTQLENDLHTRWVRKFTFGINFPVSQITQALKGKK